MTKSQGYMSAGLQTPSLKRTQILLKLTYRINRSLRSVAKQILTERGATERSRLMRVIFSKGQKFSATFRKKIFEFAPEPSLFFD